MPHDVTHDDIDFARRVAAKTASKYMPYGVVDMEDFIQVGMVGLVEAAKRFDPDGTASFMIYAYKRIVGSLVDECRRMGFTKRRGREKELDPHILSLNWEDDEGNTLEVEAPSQDWDARMDLMAAVGALPARERFIVVARMLGFTNREIAPHLGVTEQRVCQLLGGARVSMEVALA